MSGEKKTWIGRLFSHGLYLVTGRDASYYTVSMNIEVDEEQGRLELTFRDPDEAERHGYSLVEYALKARLQNISLAWQSFTHKGGQSDAHTSHCCLWHGCKYAEDEECSVATTEKPQRHMCEQCDYELAEAREKAASLLQQANQIRSLRLSLAQRLPGSPG